MILDWGVHLIDQMLKLIPEKIKGIYCEITNITTDEVDDGFNLHITFESGKRATVEVGTYNFIAMPRFYMRAEKGTALITDWREETKVVKCKYWHENDVLPVQTAAGLTKTMAPRDEITTDTYTVARPASDVHDYYRHFVNAIRTGCEQDVTWDQMRTDLKIIFAAFRSAEQGVPVGLE
jgi:predicted dehydrogenase